MLEVEPEEHIELLPDGGGSEVVAVSVGLHPRLVEALSEVPYSALYGVLWPIIVEQASFETRDQLRNVNDYFKDLCYPHRRSDRAKHDYVSHYGSRQKYEGIPYVLDLSFDVEWRCWGADKYVLSWAFRQEHEGIASILMIVGRCAFNNVETFRKFCALGDVDPDTGRGWNKYPSVSLRYHAGLENFIWVSRTKDIVFETSHNPLDGGYCHYFGLTGVADKAITMYNFMHDNYGEYSEDDKMTTSWAVMGWDRDYC